MRFAAVAVLAALLGCSQPVDPAIQGVLDAGNTLVATLEKCTAHMKTAKKTDIPECNARKQSAAYTEAKLRVTTPGIPAVEAMEQKVNAATLEATSTVINLNR